MTHTYVRRAAIWMLNPSLANWSSRLVFYLTTLPKVAVWPLFVGRVFGHAKLSAA